MLVRLEKPQLNHSVTLPCDLAIQMMVGNPQILVRREEWKRNEKAGKSNTTQQPGINTGTQAQPLPQTGLRTRAEQCQ